MQPHLIVKCSTLVLLLSTKYYHYPYYSSPTNLHREELVGLLALALADEEDLAEGTLSDLLVVVEVSTMKGLASHFRCHFRFVLRLGPHILLFVITLQPGPKSVDMLVMIKRLLKSIEMRKEFWPCILPRAAGQNQGFRLTWSSPWAE